MSKWVDSEEVVCLQLYSAETEEWYTRKLTIEELLDCYTDEGCQPTIDIVLCKECIYYMPKNQQLRCAFHSTYVDEDAFCSYGERSE